MKKKKFASGLCFNKLFIIFVICSVFGALYEESLNFIKVFLSTGNADWVYRRGVIYGPISPIYGFGAVIFLLLLNKSKKWYKTLLYGSLIGGIFEYLSSCIQELITGTTSWNYSKQFLNINGRTTVPIMLCWGILCVIFIHIIYPYLSNLIERIPIQVGNIITSILLILIVIDLVVSWSAVIRQSMRRNGIKEYTVVDKFYDRYYTDKFLKKYYTNMVPTKEVK